MAILLEYMGILFEYILVDMNTNGNIIGIYSCWYEYMGILLEYTGIL